MGVCSLVYCFFARGRRDLVFGLVSLLCVHIFSGSGIQGGFLFFGPFSTLGAAGRLGLG